MKKIAGYLIAAALVILAACQVSYAVEKQTLLGEKEIFNVPGRCAEDVSADITIKKEVVDIKSDADRQAIKQMEDKSSNIVLRGKGDIRVPPIIVEKPINEIAPKPDLPAAPKAVDPELLKRFGYPGPKEEPQAPAFKPVIKDIDQTGDKIKKDPVTVMDESKFVSGLAPRYTGGAVMNMTTTVTSVKVPEETPVTGLAPRPDLPAAPQPINPDLLRRLGYARPKGLGQAPVFRPEIRIIKEEKPEADRDEDVDRVTSPVRRPYEFGGGAVLRGTVTIDRQITE